jgi:hypothetical protein
VWGHKTTWGLVPKTGHDHPAMSRSESFVAAADGPLSIAGPLARNAADTAHSITSPPFAIGAPPRLLTEEGRALLLETDGQLLLF